MTNAADVGVRAGRRGRAGRPRRAGAAAAGGADAGRRRAAALTPATSLALDGRAARVRLEEIVIEQLSRPEVELTIDRIVAAVLDDERTERVMERALASPGLERLIVRILESSWSTSSPSACSPARSCSASSATWPSSPEVMDALSHQTETLADEMVTDVRQRAQRVDDLAERTVRGWLRRPRPQPT